MVHYATWYNVSPEVERFIGDALQHKLPLGFICIAPAIMGKVAQHLGLTTTLTLGMGEEWGQK